MTNFVSDALLEVCPYYNMIEYAHTPTCITFSQVFFDTLTEEQQGWVMEAGELTEAYSREDYVTSFPLLQEAAAAGGAEYNIVEDKSSFIQASQGVWDTMAEKIDGGQEIVDLIRQVKAEYTGN